MLPAVWIATIVLFGIIEPSTFLTHANLSSILSTPRRRSLIVALALLLPLTVDDFDLSFRVQCRPVDNRRRRA